MTQSIKITFARHFNDVVSTNKIGKQNGEDEDFNPIKRTFVMKCN